MASLDLTAFREMFPEFSDTTKYPDAMITLYWNLAGDFINADGCPCAILQDPALTDALYMLTAHLLALATQRAADAAAGNVAGAGGTVVSATIGSVSVTTMTPPAAEGWNYWLSQTPYGQMLWALLSIKSVGGTSVGMLPERLGFRKVGGVFW